MTESADGDRVETDDQRLLSEAAILSFRLNGQFLAVAEELAATAGLTAARWQVLGAVLHEPLPVAGIARSMGITRQSVQRTADILVEQGLAEYAPNPAHRRAKLVRITTAGRTAVSRISPAHRSFAGRLADDVGRETFASATEALGRLSESLDQIAPGGVGVVLHADDR